MINELVMDKGRKTTLTSLAKSFARRDKHGGEVSRPIWSADFVKGKGNGLIFLLHGRPGVGKTCTAGELSFIFPHQANMTDDELECIAAFTRRPLMVLTPSDVGNTPGDVEVNLTKMFKRAVSWGAVLLVDEADVFMERRSTSDLARNSLVASKLKSLPHDSSLIRVKASFARSRIMTVFYSLQQTVSGLLTMLSYPVCMSSCTIQSSRTRSVRWFGRHSLTS